MNQKSNPKFFSGLLHLPTQESGVKCPRESCAGSMKQNIRIDAEGKRLIMKHNRCSAFMETKDSVSESQKKPVLEIPVNPSLL